MEKKRLIALTVVGLVALTVLFSVDFAQAGGIRGHYRSNGTYVQPYQRSAPDGNPYNNYGFPGNYNPNSGGITPGNPNTYLDNYFKPSSPSINIYPRSPYNYKFK
jgi:hypothetical protein